jgi:GMP reductase
MDMRIENEVKLDFNDVLIKPKRSLAVSRSEVELTREFKLLNCELYKNKPWDAGVPIVAANMTTVASLKVAEALAKHNCWTALHKFYDLAVLEKFFKDAEGINHRTFYTMGTTDDDYQKLRMLFKLAVPLPNICIDIANGYRQSFVKFVREIREMCPRSVIMAGNVCTPEMTIELLIEGKADLIKVGIGGGCFVAGTKVKTKDGTKPIEKVKAGDEVYTHTGSIKKVISTMSRKENKTIISVNGINCTPNHEFYVVEKKYKGIITDDNIHLYAKWVSAEDLNDNYFLIKLTNNT